jgi:putative transposase
MSNSNVITKEIIKSYKFKIFPTEKEKNILSQWFGSRRFLYNYFANIQLEKFDKNEKPLSNYDLDKITTDLKKEYPFLKEVNSQALQQVSKDNYRAIKTFFRKAKKKEFSNKFVFKKKYDSKQSISFPNYKNNVKFIHNYKVFNKPKTCYIQIPKLKTHLKILKHRNIEGEIKNVTLSKESDCYYISLQTKQAITLSVDNKPLSSIGVDLGVKKLITTSEGEVFKPLNAFKKYKNKLAKLQRQLAKCVKKSNNFIRLKKRINKLHKKIANSRKNYLHSISTYLVNNHAIIFIENLNIKNMSKSAKGTIEEKGKNVKQKSGLNLSILEQGWGIFGDMLKYKQEWRNQTFEKENAKFSSEECCLCHSKHKENRLSQSKFVCKSCDNKLNADQNASLNILYRGLLTIGLTVNEAQSIINKKLGRKLFYTNLWIQEGKTSRDVLSSGLKVT